VVSLEQQRAVADYLGERYGVAIRRICGVLGRSRSTLRHRCKSQRDEPALTREIKRLARRHPRYDYRRIPKLLNRRGWTVNLKRVRRLWNELGLRRPLRLNKPRKLGPKPGTTPTVVSRNRPGSRTTSGPAPSSRLGWPLATQSRG
jgi:hypothetical protein